MNNWNLNMLNKILSDFFLIFMTGVVCGMALIMLVLSFYFLCLTADI